MVIKKEYNIQGLAEELEKEIDDCEKYNGTVKLDIITALEILEVLLETYRREQKHQTTESALTPYEVETKKLVRTKGDSAEYKKELKESEIPSCFGNYGTEDKEDCTCVFCEYELSCRRETEQNKRKRRPDCFNVMCGDFEACQRCEYRPYCVHEVKEQKTNNDTAPDCYGCYDDKDLDCNNCKSKESCVEDTMKEKEEDDDFI